MITKENVKQFVIYFKSSIILQIVLAPMLFNLMFIRNFSIFSLILMFGINIIGLGLNNDSDGRKYSISVVYVLLIFIIFIIYFSINGFSFYGKWVSLSITEYKNELHSLLEILYLFFGIIWTLSISIFGLKIIIYTTIKNKENTNFYAALTLGSTMIFSLLFNSISQETNNWSYFIAIGSFFMLFFDYNIFLDAFSKSNKNNEGSEEEKELKQIVKKKFARIKLLISASTLVAVLIEVLKKPLIGLYNQIFHQHFKETDMATNKLGLYLNISIAIFYILIIGVLVYFGVKEIIVRSIMKQRKLAGPKNRKFIWDRTWNIKNEAKRIPYLEDIIIFYEMISSGRENK